MWLTVGLSVCAGVLPPSVHPTTTMFNEKRESVTNKRRGTRKARLPLPSRNA